MKKAIFTVMVTLAVLAVIGCPATTDPAEYTADGRRLVNLTINPSLSRALTTPLAKGGVDYYEVVFKDGANYYHTAWDYTKSGKIKIPAGTYGNGTTKGDATKAILFAGHYADKTLLAVGIITTPVGGVIAVDTTSVTFTLAALEGSADASFTVTSPGGITSTPITNIEANITVNMFPLPKNSTSITAEYEITTTDFDTEYCPGIVLVGPTSPRKVDSAGIYAPGYGLVVVTGSITAPAAAANTPMIDTITFGITTPNADGLSRLSFEIPVCAIDNAVNGITWYIRGGLGNAFVDEGATANSTGGAIVLGVGAVNPFTIKPVLP